MKSTHSVFWKIGFGLLLCLGCCAAPLLVGVAGVTGALGLAILSSHLEISLLLGTLLILFLIHIARAKKGKKCAVDCTCKGNSGLPSAG